MRDRLIAAELWSVDDPRDPSVDPGAAIEVFLSFGECHKILTHKPRRSLGWDLGQPYEWHCTIYAANTVTADALPEAICRAALQAVEIRASIRNAGQG
ncbi:MAG TPA: hypothetical protein VFZ66_29895 [Herpetosiphonaceae bacterium]